MTQERRKDDRHPDRPLDWSDTENLAGQQWRDPVVPAAAPVAATEQATKDAEDLIAVATQLREVKHWAAQASVSLLAEIAGRILKAAPAAPLATPADAGAGQQADCTVPPEGWHCTRAAGHEGPCAAVPVNEDGYTAEQEAIYQRGLEDGKLVAGGMARLARMSTPGAPVTAEPVAYMYQDDADKAEPGKGSCVVTKSRNRFYRNETPLYTHSAPADRDAIRDAALEEAASVYMVGEVAAREIRKLKSMERAADAKGGQQ